MKKLYYCAFPLVILFTSACMKNEYVLESDYSYRGDFKRYNSFSFINDVAVNKDSFLTAYRPFLEKTIQNRMEILGYKFTDKKPRLLIAYSIFGDDLKFQGYNQLELEEWLDKNDEEDEYMPTKLDMNEGTLLIQFIDSRRNHTVWQGYASGVLGNNGFNNERHLRRAVWSIFEQYRIMAEGFDMSHRGG